TLWHQRLGHPADQVLDILKTTLNLDRKDIKVKKSKNDQNRQETEKTSDQEKTRGKISKPDQPDTRKKSK
ncbi:hypothetical protein Tco_0684601, partial [Tanacetum coccineum]